MKFFGLILILSLNFLSVSKANSQAGDPVDIAANLSQQLLMLNNMSLTVDRMDRARILVLQRAVEAVQSDMLANVASNRAHITFQTLRLIQNLIVQYRFSKSFLGWTQPPSPNSIYADSIQYEIAELKVLAENIEVVFGFDDSPYTQITAQTFRQLQRLFSQLEGASLNPERNAEYRALWPKIGETIAVAEQGDRPNAFSKGTLMVEKIRQLYPAFQTVSTNSAAFFIVLEIQGLTEFYAEYAQIKEGR